MIHRFSEDIDLGIERKDIGLGGELDPMSTTTRSGHQKAVKEMRVREQPSRHAYDLAMMHRAGSMADVTLDLFEEVARHKFVFGDTPQVPDALRSLNSDYTKMEPMLFTTPAPPTFDEVVTELVALEAAINALTG